MLKTKDKQSKNDNTINSFLAIQGESTESCPSSRECRKGGSRETRTNENKQKIKKSKKFFKLMNNQKLNIHYKNKRLYD